MNGEISDILKSTYRKQLGEMNLSILMQVQGRVGHRNCHTGLFKQPTELEKC